MLIYALAVCILMASVLLWWWQADYRNGDARTREVSEDLGRYLEQRRGKWKP